MRAGRRGLRAAAVCVNSLAWLAHDLECRLKSSPQTAAEAAKKPVGQHVEAAGEAEGGAVNHT